MSCKIILVFSTLRLILGVSALLPSAKHKIITSDVEVIDKFLDFYERPNRSKLWSELWKLFDDDYVDLCEEAYGAFTKNKNNEEKLEFELCNPESSDSTNNEFLHISTEEGSFSIDSLCCQTRTGPSDHVLKYYLTEAEDECVFVLFEVEYELTADGNDNVTDEKEEEKLDEVETTIEVRYEICPVDSDEIIRPDDKAKAPQTEKALPEPDKVKTDDSEVGTSSREQRPPDVLLERESNEDMYGVFRVGLRKRKPGGH